MRFIKNQSYVHKIAANIDFLAWISTSATWTSLWCKTSVSIHNTLLLMTFKNKKNKKKHKSIFQLLTRLKKDNNPINYHVKHDIKRNLLNFIWIIHMQKIITKGLAKVSNTTRCILVDTSYFPYFLSLIFFLQTKQRII